MIILLTPVFCQVAPNDSLFGNGTHFLQPRKFDYGVTLGSVFSTASGYGSALNTYVTPRISYNVNKRLAIGGGISIIQTNLFNVTSPLFREQSSGYNGNFTSAVLFVDGQYLVNSRLTLSGSAFKQIPITQNPLPYNPFSPVSAKGAQGINFNVGYKIGEHMYIQAGFRYSEGLNPYYTDPLHRNSFLDDSFGSQPGYGIPRW